MRTILKVIVGIQILLGIGWTLPLLRGNGDFSTLYLFFLLAIVNAAFLLVACRAMWKHPNERRIAGVVMMLPALFLFLPGVIKWFAGGPLTSEALVRAAVVLLVAALLFSVAFPKQVIRILPEWLFRSRIFNWLLLLGMAIAWLLPIAGVAWLASSDSGNSRSGMAVAYVIIYVAMYVVAVGAVSVLVMVHGWIGLRSGVARDCRRLNIAQIVMGLPSFAIGAATLAWLANQNS